MNSKNYSRREFLETFATLSTAPILAGLLFACGGSGSGQVAMYAPAPPNETWVVVMFFLDAQNNKINLWINNQAVPVHTSFVIQFGDSMNVASVAAAITFINSNNNPVAFALSSDQNAPCSVNVNITPTADLLPNTNYILSVNDTAVDCSGTKHIVKTSAAFTTSA